MDAIYPRSGLIAVLPISWLPGRMERNCSVCSKTSTAAGKGREKSRFKCSNCKKEVHPLCFGQHKCQITNIVNSVIVFKIFYQSENSLCVPSKQYSVCALDNLCLILDYARLRFLSQWDTV